MDRVLSSLTLIPLAVEVAMNMLVAAVTGFIIGTFVALILFSLLRANGPDEEPAWDDGEDKP